MEVVEEEEEEVDGVSCSGIRAVDSNSQGGSRGGSSGGDGKISPSSILSPVRLASVDAAASTAFGLRLLLCSFTALER